eukprot:5849928-Amphidinium_carterae.2
MKRLPTTISFLSLLVAGSGQPLEDEEGTPLPAARKGRGNSSSPSSNRLRVPGDGCKIRR